MRFFYWLIILLLSSYPVNAQEYDFFVPNNNYDDSSDLFLRIDNNNFLKNNEYFGNMIAGYTLIGYNLNLSLHYKPFDRFEFVPELYFLQYFGIDSFSRIKPRIKVIYKLTDKFTAVFGHIYDALYHNMPDPLFAFENQLTKNDENGLQFLYNSGFYDFDLWIDWRQFIFKGSKYPEKFTLGYSSFIDNKSTNLHIKVPLQLIATHTGGQIDRSGVPVQTLINYDTGIILEKKVSDLGISASSYYIGFIDFSPRKQLPYLMGYGIYSQFLLKFRNTGLNLSHWYGDMFVPAIGNPMFSSMSSVYTTYKQNKTAFAIVKIFFDNMIFDKVSFRFQIDTYYDLYNYNLLYSYAFYLRFNDILYSKNTKK